MSQTRAANLEEETVYLQKATEMLEAGNSQQAISSLEEGLVRFPSSPELLQKKSQLLLEDQKFEEVLRIVSNIDEPNFEIQIIKGKALYALDNKDEALEIYEGLKKSSCYNIEQANKLDLIIAKIYLDQAKFRKALDLYKLILKSDHHNLECLKSLWFIYEITGDHEESQKFHNEILENDSYNSRAWYNLGHAYKNNANLEDAIHAFEMSKTIDENNIDANWFHALCQKDSGKYEEAIDSFNRHYELVGEKEPSIFIELAECYLATENFSFAFFYSSKYQQLDDSAWDSYLYKGLSLVHYANHPEAIENYKKALEINPKEGIIHTNLGLAYYHSGEHKKAFKHLIEAMDINPDNLQNWLLAIEFLIRHEEIKSALHLCDNAFEIFEDDSAMIYKAACYFTKGDSINAYKCLEDFDSVNKEQFSQILSLCPSLYHDEQFRGFFRFCLNSKKLPIMEQGEQDLPDGFYEFEN